MLPHVDFSGGNLKCHLKFLLGWLIWLSLWGNMAIGRFLGLQVVDDVQTEVEVVTGTALDTEQKVHPGGDFLENQGPKSANLK